MKRGTFNYIKQLLKDYRNIDQYIKEREQELRHPYHLSDVNADIKSKNKKSDHEVNLLITIEQDRRLRVLAKNKAVIKNNLDSSDEDTRTIIHELYIKQYPIYTIDGLVDNFLIDCGRTKAYQLRDEFFNRVADDLMLEK